MNIKEFHLNDLVLTSEGQDCVLVTGSKFVAHDVSHKLKKGGVRGVTSVKNENRFPRTDSIQFPGHQKVRAMRILENYYNECFTAHFG